MAQCGSIEIPINWTMFKCGLSSLWDYITICQFWITNLISFPSFMKLTFSFSVWFRKESDVLEITIINCHKQLFYSYSLTSPYSFVHNSIWSSFSTLYIFNKVHYLPSSCSRSKSEDVINHFFSISIVSNFTDDGLLTDIRIWGGDVYTVRFVSEVRPIEFP